ncbi:hypothetical protein ABZX97_07830 [Streptomyces seoulensis]|uniref:hypothetical protein n=1 Tax=Streptomyces seoulensis TaxID=73044 RepID=UPI0033BC5B54
MGTAPNVFMRHRTEDQQGVRIEGTCPRCHGNTASEYRFGTPGTGTKGLADLLRGVRPSREEEVESGALLREVHFCECGHPHPELPVNAPFIGCGASWQVLELNEGEQSG